MSAIALDPLIAEAKRRARRRRYLFVTLAVVAIGALSYGLLPSGRSGGAAGSQSLPTSLAARLALAARDRLPLDSAWYAGGGVAAAWAVNGDAWYSTNDGRSWRRRAADPASSMYAPGVFVNRRDGWFQAGEYLDRTTDGGRSWTRLPLPEVGPYGDTVSGFTFVNRTVGFLGVFRQAGGPDNLYVTRDGGTTWQLRGTLPPNGTGFDDFADARLGFATRSPGVVYATRDAGRTWSVLRNWPCTRSETYPGATSVVVQCGRSFYVSTDRGSSWSLRRAPTAFSLLNVLNDRTWVALRGTSIFVTTSAGRSWHRAGRLAVPPHWEISNPEFTSLKTAQAAFGRRPPRAHPSPYIPEYAGPNSFVLMRTTDGGRHWTPGGPLKPKAPSSG